MREFFLLLVNEITTATWISKVCFLSLNLVAKFEVHLLQILCLMLKVCSMRYFYLYLVVLTWFLSIPSTHELQLAQTQVLLQLRKYLEYPTSLLMLENYYGDLCSLPASANVAIKCEGNSVIELKIMGDRVVKVDKFNGYAVPNKTLSVSFSIDSFVTTLTRLTNLRVLRLVSLGIWGPLPDKIHRLSLLQVLDLSSNFLYGSVPPRVSTMVKLHTLTLDGNYLNSTMPDWLGSLSNLNVLSLKSNHLKGSFPSSLCKISSLADISLSHNNLSGALPDLTALSSLHVLDLRENHLDSELPLMPKAVVTILLSKNSFSGFISQVAKLGTQATPTCRQFSIEELKEVTRNFDLSTYIGEGSLGKMYKGKLENGSYVAIRCLALSKKCSMQNLKARLDLLSKLHHPNLVSLLGHCIDGDGQDDSSGLKLHLVYEYVPYGNYHTYMSEKALKWSERLAILIGVAKAVHFLHTGVIPGCFRNQLKAHNVLLDEHHIPKLSDYGMSMISEEIEYLEVKGENPKSCQREKLEDDVYNFGLISFESLVGPIASEKGVEFFLHDKVSFDSQDGRNKIVDPVVLNTCCPESLSIAISITTKCLSPESSSPPSFEDVLWNLQYAAQVQAIADADQKSDSTTS
ncbi:probable inactive leucine-rich repeat receptor-like protein kinase At3g03770 isoform X3 [Cajanus cajan]|uniref:probable inactive leucine-rich repeat receptor-like protein kinase At3g03770 isoform X3 n=1 Tax=Cajanus cajan TaxID=3821 RepID=UPI00098D86C9|nr:probable inactive leucine-rich repeat receptor-like protein kinase At3g03770 isoform X3 [Cajanus cajan]